MKLALISDIHGNAVAFNAVLDQLAHQQIDQLICLGDAVATGPQPAECVELLRQNQIPTIMGNADAWLLDPQRNPEASEFHRFIEEIDLWCQEQLNDAALTFIEQFPTTLEYPLSTNHTLLAYHGSPRSFNEGVRPDTPAETLHELLPESYITIMAGGHIHQPFLRRYLDLMILNPGSVGLGYQHERETKKPANIGWAEYAVLEIGPDLPDDPGNLKIEFHRVPYSVEVLGKVARSSSMPGAERWLEGWA
ncbi:MAG: metallophosphoesterase family protein [Chloroflexota bacterium]